MDHTQRNKLARDLLAANKFVPAEGPVETHSIHALNYIAFYLGEIEQHLSVIARAVERSAPNVDKLSDLVEDVLKR